MMRVLDPGHRFELAHLDGSGVSILQFVKRIGEKFPGNAPPGHEGTTTQEVLRALIDRIKYVDRQIPHPSNEQAYRHLVEALRWLEMRAAERRSDEAAWQRIFVMVKPELEPTCITCGHIECLAHGAKP